MEPIAPSKSLFVNPILSPDCDELTPILLKFVLSASEYVEYVGKPINTLKKHPLARMKNLKIG